MDLDEWGQRKTEHHRLILGANNDRWLAATSRLVHELHMERMPWIHRIDLLYWGGQRLFSRLSPVRQRRTKPTVIIHTYSQETYLKTRFFNTITYGESTFTSWMATASSGTTVHPREQRRTHYQTQILPLSLLPTNRDPQPTPGRLQAETQTGQHVFPLPTKGSNKSNYFS